MKRKEKVRGFVCITADPVGCEKNVQNQIEFIKSQRSFNQNNQNVLIIGSSTGYGLSSRIASAFGLGAKTIGVFWERPTINNRPASAGWYNSVAFENFAKTEKLYAKSINGDAYSEVVKNATIDLIKKDLGKIDLVIYSLASPKRIDPETGIIYNSVLKTIESPFFSKNLNTDKKTIDEIKIEVASQKEIDSTVKVMGGEDWQLWIDKLYKENLLSNNFKTIAYSYIGPKLTWPIYKEGTIGKAKQNLEFYSEYISKKLIPINGKAYVSINKALVTQASSAIPIVPLYISLLYKIMKEKHIHEGCIEQIFRLYSDHLYSKNSPALDNMGRIRLDDFEMREDIQDHVIKLWSMIKTENIDELSDFQGYKKDFLNLFGFEVDGVDYNKEVNLIANFPNGIKDFSNFKC